MVNTISINQSQAVKTQQPKASGKTQQPSDSFDSFVKKAIDSQQAATEGPATKQDTSDAVSDKETANSGKQPADQVNTEQEETVIEPSDHAAMLAFAVLALQQPIVTEEMPTAPVGGNGETPAAAVEPVVDLGPTTTGQELDPSILAGQSTEQAQVVQEQPAVAKETQQPTILNAAEPSAQETKAVSASAIMHPESTAPEQTAETAKPVENTRQVEQQAPVKQAEETPVAEVKQESASTDTKDKSSDANSFSQADSLAQAVLPKTMEIDGKLLHVKVGEGEGEPLNAQNKEFPDQLADRILYHAENGKNEFQIKLTPKELGEINIKIVFEDGKATVSMACSNAKTMSILTQQAQNIGALIENHTGSQTTVTVEENKAYQEQNKDTYEGHGQNSRKGDQEERHTERKQNPQDFLQKLRLGLVDFSDSFE